MSDTLIWKIGGAAIAIWGLKLILYGGTKTINGSHFELFGFEFGTSETESMSTFECWLVGLALIAGGAFVFLNTV